MEHYLDAAITKLDSMLRNQDFNRLNSSVSELLLKDPNNSQLLYFKLQALLGLGKALEDIGFLRKYCWYRSLDDVGFWMLHKAYQNLGDDKNAIVALIYALSIAPQNTDYSTALSSMVRECGYETVKLSILRVDRIGHMSFESDVWLRFKSAALPDIKTMFIFLCEGPDKVSNQFCFELLQRYMTVVQNDFWIKILKSRPGLLAPGFFQSIPYDSTGWPLGFGHQEHDNAKQFKELQNILNQNRTKVELSQDDESKGCKLLKKRGVDLNKPFVSLHVRDSEYLKEKSGGTSADGIHSYRNCILETYKKGVEYLLERGYQVIRLGKKTNQSMRLESAAYFDFTQNRNDEEDDFLDVYITARSQFFIGTTSGPVSVANLFDTPCLLTNSVPLIPYVTSHSRCVPKVYLDSTKKPVNFLDLICGEHTLTDSNNNIMNTFSGSELADAGYSIRDNSAMEIVHAVREFEAIVVNRKIVAEVTAAQREFMECIPEGQPMKGSSSLVVDSFIQQNRELFKPSKE